MATYVSTVCFTKQGFEDIKGSPKRAEAFQAMASEMGVTVKDLIWTQGAIDGLIVMDAPDDESAAALMLRLAGFGNVTTQTSRAFSADEMRGIINKLGG